MNVYTKDPQQDAQACIIWMHGLGADASDMAGLAEQLVIEDVAFRHVFIDAPVRNVTLNNNMAMRAWYDITGLELTDREDKEGVLASMEIIHKVINTQIKAGFSAKQIFLAGFSQGGAMALYTALNNSLPLAGVITLSAYLPLAAESKADLPRATPMFIASGLYDPIVLPAWTHLSTQWLASAGYEQITFSSYPMEHSICAAEINDLSRWLITQVKGAMQ